ncbi:glycosyltransferase [Humidisolicoccus flavus]|uniref:glycosyltransferase n=1 Tax=Humidisolicoccus flavus TaxID=3111414 RepID=UPI0032504B1F
MIQRFGIVIPAHNEAELIARCLEGIAVAVAKVATPVHTIVIADSCSDSTATIARTFTGVEVIETSAKNVGAARALGCSIAIAHGADWIAHTDADSVVPPQWLQVQAALAASGVDVVIGTVRPDFRDLDPARTQRWLDTHVDGVANGHVHGANLGSSTAAYLRAGGYLPMIEHEDVDLTARMRALGINVAATADAEVLTSGRLQGRTPGGYARHLRDDLLPMEQISE